MSILARLARLQGITIDGIEPPRTTPRTTQTQDRTPVRNIVSAPVFDFAPDQTTEEVVEASAGAAEAEGIISQPPDEIVPPSEPPGEPSGGDEPPVENEQEVFVSNQVTIYKNGAVSTAQGNRRPGETQSELERMLADGWSTTKPFEGPQPPQIPGTTTVPGEPVEEFDAKAFAQTNYPWLGDELIDTFLQEFNTNGGDEDEALRVLRTTQAYRDKFPGIFRDDNTTLRIEGDTPELDYIKIKEDYSNLLSDYNLNPEYFEGQIETLFRNDVAPRVFEQRLNTAYNSLFNQFDAVKQYYVSNYPSVFPTTEDITDEAIFASFISEDISADIINKRIQVSQIGGAFQEQDFAISTEQAQRLISAGVTGQGAQQLAARAEVQLPRLQRLAQRFTGREDIFGLSEFIESEVFGSGVAEQVRQRLEAEQQTVFTREGGAAATQAGLTGLIEQ